MTEGQTLGSVQAAHLAEGIALIREDLRRMAEDIKQRPTHSDLGSLKLLVEKQVELVQQQLSQDRERHAREMDYLQEKYDQLKVDMKEVAKKQDATEDDKKKLQRHMLYSFLGAIAVAAGGVTWQAVLP